ncbi:hypothetical protein LCGC14_3056280 [marine sediment metagenome]|uniref:Uncharacterized protein n=1 Tax=marine sediment metagenome TaxID=412755 RepID=A0A0F8WKP2_9ZZZZ
MSSQVEKKNHIIHKYKPLLEDSIDFSKIIIPFSDFEKSKKTSFIHDGTEMAIKFNETHLVFQAVMLNEFIDINDEQEN